MDEAHELLTSIWEALRCPKCGGVLVVRSEAYRDEDFLKISISLVCRKCGSKYVLPLPLVEYR
jgi:predicted RNA-binding Zn-ribbon protein involved in translation (DUF1610 family)